MNQMHFTFDVFLSHCSADKPAVHALAERLRNDGFRVWLDDWEIRPGDDIFLKIEHGLQNSRCLLFIISPNSFASEWISLERSTALFRDPANTRRRFVPLLMETCSIPDTIRRYHIIDYRKQSSTAYAAIVEACRVVTIPDNSAAEETRTATPSVLSACPKRIVSSLQHQNLQYELAAVGQDERFHLVVNCEPFFRKPLEIHVVYLGNCDRVTWYDDYERELSLKRIPATEIAIVVSNQPTLEPRTGSIWRALNVDNFLHLLETGNLKQYLVSHFALSKFNPYQSFRPVASEMFFGRRNELEALLRSDHGYAVVGPRRIGKSSLAMRFFRQLHVFGEPRFSSDRFSFSYVDAGTLVDPDDLWDRMIVAMSLEARDLAAGMFKKKRLGTRQLTDRPSYEIIRNLIRQKYRRFVLIIDEADQLIRDDFDTRWATMERLRALTDGLGGAVRVFLFGHKTLYRAIHNSSFPLFGRLSIHRLGSLDVREVDELIETPMRDLGIEFTNLPRLKYEIHTLTGGLPNLVQEVCRTIVDSLENTRMPLSTTRALEILEARQADLQFRIATLISDLPDQLPKLIAYLFADISILRIRDIHEQLQSDHNIKIQTDVIRRALESLYLDNIVRPSGENDAYTFTSVMVKELLVRDSAELIGAGLLEDFIERVRKVCADPEQIDE